MTLPCPGPAGRSFRISPCRLATRRLRAIWTRARDDESGSTAIEFGLVALPFFALILAIAEIGLMFFAGRILDNAVSDSARLIRTGQAYKAGFNATTFKQDVMARLPNFFSSDRLAIDVRTFSSFAGVSLPPPIDDDKKLVDNFTYNSGGASDIVVVRVFYRWPMVGSYMGVNFADLADGSRLLGAIQAFRNEPFPETTSSLVGEGTVS